MQHLTRGNRCNDQLRLPVIGKDSVSLAKECQAQLLKMTMIASSDIAFPVAETVEAGEAQELGVALGADHPYLGFPHSPGRGTTVCMAGPCRKKSRRNQCRDCQRFLDPHPHPRARHIAQGDGAKVVVSPRDRHRGWGSRNRFGPTARCLSQHDQRIRPIRAVVYCKKCMLEEAERSSSTSVEAGGDKLVTLPPVCSLHEGWSSRP